MTVRVATSAIRFGVTGLFNTAVHALVAMSCIQTLGLSQASANATAFVVATACSYVINTRWSFSRSMNSRSGSRFAVVSLIGLLLATAMGKAADALGIHYGLGILLVVSTVTPLTFLLHLGWTYAAHRAAYPRQKTGVDAQR